MTGGAQDRDRVAGDGRWVRPGYIATAAVLFVGLAGIALFIPAGIVRTHIGDLGVVPFLYATLRSVSFIRLRMALERAENDPHRAQGRDRGPALLRRPRGAFAARERKKHGAAALRPQIFPDFSPVALGSSVAIAVLVEGAQALNVVGRLGLSDSALARTLIGTTFDVWDLVMYGAGGFCVLAGEALRGAVRRAHS